MRQLFSQCVYDVDAHYVDLCIRKTRNSFMLSLQDYSNDADHDNEIGIHLTKDDLKFVIGQLTLELER